MEEGVKGAGVSITIGKEIYSSNGNENFAGEAKAADEGADGSVNLHVDNDAQVLRGLSALRTK